MCPWTFALCSSERYISKPSLFCAPKYLTFFNTTPLPSVPSSRFSFMVAIALVLFVLNLAGSVWGRRGRLAAADPWEAGTPEWAPPPDDVEPVSAEEQT